MTNHISFFRNQAGRILALVLIAATYAASQLPKISNAEISELASQFQFQSIALPSKTSASQSNVYPVSPQLEHISAWISSLGASVAFDDLDNDGLANDLCWVDVRIKQVMITPVPGSSDRYPTQVLNPAPLYYDEATMAPMGCLPGDMNEDGYMDILVYYWGRPPIAFLSFAFSACIR